MLKEIVPARYRAIAYRVYAVAVLIVTAVQVGFVSAEKAQPTALSVAIAVLAYAGAALGLVAAANTPVKDVSSPSDGL